MYQRLRTLYYIFYNFKKNHYLQRLQKRGLILGKNVWIVDTFFFDPSHCYLISIGDNSVICPNVRLIAHDASTRLLLGYTKFGKITIKENCFIGDSTIILADVTIGPNSIVGAGSVVTRSIPANTVAAGNPAKKICSIDDYRSKIKNLADSKKRVFGKEYYISHLTDVTRAELLAEVENGIGFIK